MQKHRTAGWPPTVKYRLTPRGRQLGPVLQALWDWGADAPTQQAIPPHPRHDPPDRP
ncbi:winged helix-turn-helix transcriptional regulator [Streptomyces sp. NBC_01358]|uniref:winged helix-turn-helix transcriptional regulator n=1 Tax=Streptomyces sp. NBC_01358 TaxID=2903837 RepID=UPI002E319A9E|nr:winged helix-turn-helix transcriptional regulator [Streptomyces sp. NBC_01358]